VNWSSHTLKTEAGVFALALMLGLTWVGCVELRGGRLRGPDAASYHALATSLLAGKGLQKHDYTGLFRDPWRSLTVRSFRPPLLPLVLAGVYGVAGQRLWVARVVMSVLSAATCVVAMRLARRAFGRRSALATGVLTALYPELVYYAGRLSTETLCTLLVTASLVLLLGAAQATRGVWRWPLAGAMLGLATLARSSVLLFAPVAALWVMVARARKRRAVGEAALLLLGFAVVMAPWWVRNARVHGRFVAATTEGGYTLWVTNNPQADGGGRCFWPPERAEFDGLSEVEIDQAFWRKGMAYIREHPGHFVRLAGAKFVRFWRLWPHASHVGLATALVGGLSFTPVLLLAVWGAIVGWPRWRPWLLFVLLVGYYTAIHMVFMAVTRYRVPIVPCLAVLAGWALVDLLGGRGQVAAARAASQAAEPPVGLSVIIPTYNEEPNIRRSAEGVVSYLRNGHRSWELLVVDDGSLDGTVAIAQELAAAHPQVRVLAHSPNRGKGYAVRQGMLAARGAVRLFLDADYSTPIEECEKLIPPLEGDCHVAIGIRRGPGAHIATKPPIHRYLMGEAYIQLAAWLLGSRVADFNCGFKAFRADAAEQLFRLQHRDDWSFDAEVLALAERLGYRIHQVPVQWAHVQATSKVHPVRDAVKSLLSLLAIRSDLRRGEYGDA